MRYLCVLLAFCLAPGWALADPLPSWRNGKVKSDILAFVEAVSDIGGPGYVSPGERIAVFDNDGTLWAEQPAYFQLLYAVDRVAKMADGNSDGDLQMLEWVTAGEGPRLGLLVRHTDDLREWAYDRESHIGKLDKALDMAKERDWSVVDMTADWRTVFPYELTQ